MTFYGTPGERVWDDERSMRVCLFDRFGKVDTDNDYIIAELLRRGYRSDKPVDPEPEVKHAKKGKE